MAKVANVRGLRNYIQELRGCASKEQEKERVDKELGKIRKKYTSDKAMSAYDKRKYMWKLLYTHMLGYNVDFGHKQAMDLIAAPAYAEKQVGYVACAVFLSERDEFLRLVINSVRNDLVSRNEAFQCLALDFTANVGGAEFAQLLTSDVMAVLGNGATRPIVRKKAALCLLRLLRKAPADSEVLSPSVWGARLAEMLTDGNLGVLLGVTTLLLGVVARSYAGYEACVPLLVAILDRCRAHDVPQDYTYYGLASPWLQVKALRVLQYFPAPEDPAVRAALVEALRRLLAGSEAVKNVNKNNAVHAIVFEAVALAMALEDAELLTAGVALLARFLAAQEPNLRYLALECLARLSGVPAVREAVVRHAGTVKACLSDADVSVARRALDLLFTVAGPESATDVVDTLLAFLPHADYALREELVLKAAVLAERFLPDLEWYVDAMLRLMLAAGEFAVNDLWQSVVHLVTNAPELHAYAARRALEALAGDGARAAGGPPPEAFLRAATHLLGEYAPLLAPETPVARAQAALAPHFAGAAPDTKALMLTAFAKMALAAPGDAALQAAVREALARHARVADAELQQRALEYAGMVEDDAVAAAARAALQPLPRWEGRGSVLMRRLQELEGEGADEGQERPGWMAGEEDRPVIAGAGERGVALASPLAAVASPVKPAEPNLLDLLDLEEAPAPPQHENGGAALSGLADLGPEPAAAAPAPAQLSPELAGHIEAWYRKLWTSASGILFEDGALQIGVKSALRGAGGALTLFVGNKTAGALALELAVERAPPHVSASFAAPVPAEVEAGRQVQVAVEVASTAPGAGDVALRLRYESRLGGAALGPLTLRLPLPPAKFAQPVDVPREVFSARWSQVVGPPFKVAAPAPAAAAALAPGALERALAALHLRVIPDVDAAAGATAAACVLHVGASAAAPAPRQVPCMVVVAPEGAVTVATADAAASAALLEQLTTVLGWGGVV